MEIAKQQLLHVEWLYCENIWVSEVQTQELWQKLTEKCQSEDS